MSGELGRARALLAEALGLGLHQVKDDAGVASLEEWDSLGHMRIVVAIERDIGVTLEAEQILGLSSTADIARLLHGFR